MSENILQKIASMRRLYNDLMRQYSELVLPWGAGYNMPESISNQASEIIEHAMNVLNDIEALEKQLGIQSKRNIPEPNARMVSNMELYWRAAPFRELLEAIACRMCWSYDEMSNYLIDLVDEWLGKYAPDCAELGSDEEFWYFICCRLQIVLARLIAEVDDETPEQAFINTVHNEIRAYLFTANTFQAFGNKFLAQ